MRRGVNQRGHIHISICGGHACLQCCASDQTSLGANDATQMPRVKNKDLEHRDSLRVRKLGSAPNIYLLVRLDQVISQTWLSRVIQH